MVVSCVVGEFAEGLELGAVLRWKTLDGVFVSIRKEGQTERETRYSPTTSDEVVRS